MSLVIEKHGNFPRKSFKPLAVKGWNEFFTLADPSTDLAHWNVHADSGVIRLTARNSMIDESDPDWNPPTAISMCVDGVVDLFNQEPPTHSEAAIRAKFQEWAQQGILESFQSASVLRKYDHFNPTGKRFAIVSAPLDLGLAEDDLALLWSNDEHFKVATIKRQQQDAQKRTKRKSPGTRVIKKKRRNS